MEPIKHVSFSCKVPACRNVVYRGVARDKSFFRFPKDREVRKVWKQFCGISADFEKCDRYFICSDHFLLSDFIGSKRLLIGAIPRIKTVSATPDQSSDIISNDNQVTLKEGDVSKDAPNSQLSIQDDPQPGCSFWSSPERSSSPLIPMEGEEDVATSPPSNVEMLESQGDFSFLSAPYQPATRARKQGILSKIGLRLYELTPKKYAMRKIHNNALSRISKLKSKLSTERDYLKTITQLYKQNKFQVMDEVLNSLTKEFINCQIQNSGKKSCAKRYSDNLKIFALSMYKRSPRLYRYMQTTFELPCPRTLKNLLNSVQFNTGFDNNLLNTLQAQVASMDKLDRFCILLFDEIKLNAGLYYEKSRQIIIGYKDLGHLGRFSQSADHALVLMVRGARKKFKQPIAYFFTSSVVSTVHLKQIIILAIKKLESIGLHVLATCCDQASTNVSATNQLCVETVSDTPSMTHFVVDERNVNRFFDACHLLKNTRNAMLGNIIEFEPGRFAKFEHIKALFQIDQKQKFKLLCKLKPENFNFIDSFNKMKVSVAARQLSHTVAGCLEVYSLKDNEDPSTSNRLPREALDTAQFVEIIDQLFDSLNGSSHLASEGKPFRCAISNESPHLQFWHDLLPKMSSWKIYNLHTGSDVTNQFQFIKGWQITIRSMIACWRKVSKAGFQYLCPRNFNQDPLENLFCCIRQHGIANTNPSCHQFIAALKTCVINNLKITMNVSGNCEDDGGDSLLNNLRLLVSQPCDSFSEDCDDSCSVSAEKIHKTEFLEGINEVRDSQALAYVCGYILRKMKDTNCTACKSDLFAPYLTDQHMYVHFKEYDDQQRLKYASDSFMLLVEQVHELLYSFLNYNGHLDHVEEKFIHFLNRNLGQQYFKCRLHATEVRNDFLKVTIPFLIFKFVKDFNIGARRPLHVTHPSTKHGKKMKKLL